MDRAGRGPRAPARSHRTTLVTTWRPRTDSGVHEAKRTTRSPCTSSRDAVGRSSRRMAQRSVQLVCSGAVFARRSPELRQRVSDRARRRPADHWPIRRGRRCAAPRPRARTRPGGRPGTPPRWPSETASRPRLPGRGCSTGPRRRPRPGPGLTVALKLHPAEGQARLECGRDNELAARRLPYPIIWSTRHGQGEVYGRAMRF